MTGHPMIPDDLVPLSIVAERLHMKPERLRELARRGKFPEVSNLDRGHYLVRARDVELWMRGTWTQAQLAADKFVSARVNPRMRGRRFRA